jgi:hypothetical protein
VPTTRNRKSAICAWVGLDSVMVALAIVFAVRVIAVVPLPNAVLAPL